MDRFYGSLLRANTLCFDVGANMGHRTASFRRLGARVIAIEPQPCCCLVLRSRFAADPAVTLVDKGVGGAPGRATMTVSNEHTLSTFSQAFINATTQSGRFPGAVWNQTLVVEMVTLDALIVEYGAPDFIKIDVEGFEPEVVRGLSRPIRLTSLEWTPELTDNVIECVLRLGRLGPIRCNLSWGEGMRLARREWMEPEALIYTLSQFRDDTHLFGDVYVRAEDVL